MSRRVAEHRQIPLNGGFINLFLDFRFINSHIK